MPVCHCVISSLYYGNTTVIFERAEMFRFVSIVDTTLGDTSLKHVRIL